MITDTMQVRCCVSEAEQLIDKVGPLGLGFSILQILPHHMMCALPFTALCYIRTMGRKGKPSIIFTWESFCIISRWFLLMLAMLQ